MAIKDLFTRKNNNEQEQRNLAIKQEEQRSLYYSDGLTFNDYTSYSTSKNMQLSSVYSATNIISNAVAVLPLNLFETDINGFKNINFTHQLNDVINQPASSINRFNYFKLLVQSILLKGNGYSKIKRNSSGQIIELQYVSSEDVDIIYDKNTRIKKFLIKSENKYYTSEEFLHFYLYSNDGIIGVSVINYAVNSLKLATDAETHSQNFFQSGANLSGIIKVQGTLNADQKNQIKNSWTSAFNGNNSIGVAILPSGLDYQPISISPQDAQLLDSRKYTVIEIARFFNISPVKLFDLTKNSYSTLEQTQLSFLQDTILPYLTLIELELNKKLFLPSERKFLTIKFDNSALLVTDKQSEVEYYSKMIVNGIMTINEVRRKLNLNDVEEGNKLMIQLNMNSVDNIINNKQEIIK